MSLGTGAESGLVVDIAFWVIAVSCIVATIAVVQLQDLFRASLFLVVSFLGVAGMFVLLRAEFLAVVQVLIYVGAISVLIIFAIVTTRDVEQGSPYNRLKVPAAVLAGLFLAGMIFVAVATEWNLIDKAADSGAFAAATNAEIVEVYSNSIPKLAGLLLRDYVLAFEVASVLLLAAVVGALTLIRER